ncbi:MAG: YtxH domain-containing protein [Gemmatimonadota bacterium]
MTDSTATDEPATTTESAVEAPVRRRRSKGSFAVGLVLGAMVGAAVALLLAPERGTDTRRRLRKRIRSVRDGAEERWQAIEAVARRELARRRR